MESYDKLRAKVSSIDVIFPGRDAGLAAQLSDGRGGRHSTRIASPIGIRSSAEWAKVRPNGRLSSSYLCEVCYGTRPLIAHARAMRWMLPSVRIGRWARIRSRSATRRSSVGDMQ